MRSRLLVVLALLIATAIAAGGYAASSGATQNRATAACRVTQKKSLSGAVSTTVAFTNKTAGAVQLYWLDYKGHLTYYATIRPGATVKQPTFNTHPWVAMDSSFRCVGYTIAPRAAYTITP